MARLAHDDALEALLQDMRSDPSGQSVREPKKRKKVAPGGCIFTDMDAPGSLPLALCG